MSFLAPGFLVAASVGALGVIALHFIVTRRPRSIAFPTARFVPDVPIAARSRSIQLSDLLLLALRVLTILLAGTALARPVFPPHRERVVRVIAADVSGSVARLGETRDSVRALFRPGDAIVIFDTAAFPLESPDSIPTTPRTHAPGLLSAGLVGALRAGSRVREGADSIELTIVSPVTTAEHDRATDIIRAQWHGRARLVPVSAALASAPLPPAEHVAGATPSSRPAFAIVRNRIDTVGAVVAHGNVIVASFERRWRYVADSLGAARVVARWVDGEPAAIERDSASTCVRSVAVPIDSTGDMLLRPDVTRFRASLNAPCGYTATTHNAAVAAMLAGSGHLALTAQFPPASDMDSPVARWLAALAIILAITDMVLRRTRSGEIER